MIQRFQFSTSGHVNIEMTLTSPNCPVAQSLPEDVAKAATDIANVMTANVDVVWDPPWTPDRMSEAAKLELGMF